MSNYNTLKYYNENSELYFEQTIKADLTACYKKFEKELPEDAYILDFGCGSGRDSKYFIDKGYKVKAIDGSQGMCDLAKRYINQDVVCMKFEELNEAEVYDGIWACSSILHVEKENLKDILERMINALKKSGVIYASFKKGTTYEIKEEKYYNNITREEIEKIINSIDKNIKITDYFETGSTTKRLGDNEVVWCNFIIKKN